MNHRIQSSLPITRLGPADRPVLHSYYDVCPESPDGRRVLVTVFESDTVPGPARVGLADRAGALLDLIGEPAEVIGHVGRFALWLDDRRIAYRHSADEAAGGWSIRDLATGAETEHPGALRQWHPGIRRGLVQTLGATPNPHRLRQGLAVVGEHGETLAEVSVADALSALPSGTPHPPVDELNFMNLKWSPDGSRFFAVFTDELFHRMHRPESVKFKTIVSFDADARDARYLGSFTHHPTWSGDGASVLAMRARGETQDLIALPADGSLDARVVLPEVPGIHPSPTPDGRSLLVDVPLRHQTACAIARFDLATGHREDLACFDHPRWNHRNGHHPHPVLSPDGARLYFNAAPEGRCGCFAAELG